jgi:hypothetical protein
MARKRVPEYLHGRRSYRLSSGLKEDIEVSLVIIEEPWVAKTGHTCIVLRL